MIAALGGDQDRLGAAGIARRELVGVGVAKAGVAAQPRPVELEVPRDLQEAGPILLLDGPPVALGVGVVDSGERVDARAGIDSERIGEPVEVGDDEGARRAIGGAEGETGLVADDPVRYGPGRLLEAIL